MHASASLAVDTRDVALRSVEVAATHSDRVMFVVLVNRVDDVLRSGELAFVEGGIAPVVVAAFKNNLVRVGAAESVRTGNHRILVHREFLDFVLGAELFDKRFKHVGRDNADSLHQVHHRKRVVALLLVHEESNAFHLTRRFGFNGIDMNCGNLFASVDGTHRVDELHIARSDLFTIAPTCSRIQIDNDRVVVLAHERTQERFHFTRQGVVRQKRFVHQVEASTHRPRRHPAFSKGVERTRSIILLPGQIERFLTRQRTAGELVLR